MLPDDLEPQQESRAERLARVERAVREVVAERTSVVLELQAGRRASDLWLLHLRGPRAAVLGVPIAILDRLPFEEVELVSSTGSEGDYRLTLVVTLPLEQQPTTMPERRAKLRYILRSRLER